MQALIVDTEVVELRPDNEVYPVVSGWYWVPVPEKIQDKINNIDWMYVRETDTFTQKPEWSGTWREYRLGNYPGYNEQLDMLFNDLDSGAIPGKETSIWYAAIKAIKDKYPKTA